MNLSLKKEIIKHIFDLFGVVKNSFNFSSVVKLTEDIFLIDKKIGFENADGTKFKNNVWSCITKISGSEIKIILADLSEEYEEFVFVIQMDNHSPCSIRLSSDEEDTGSIFFNIENNWIEVGTAEQAKILVAIENIAALFPKWDKNTNYKDMYKNLINFMNFFEKE